MSNMKEYEKWAKEKWDGTKAYKEYEEKAKARTEEDEQRIGEGLMAIFSEMSLLREKKPESETVQAMVGKLQEYITENYYSCDNTILKSLGKMYSAGGEFTSNINAVGGEGFADFVDEAIQYYCR